MTRSGRLTTVSAIAAYLAIMPLLPLTQTDGWLIPAAIAITMVAFTGAALRRWRTPRAVVPLVQLGVLVLWLGLLVAADVAWMGIVPTSSWFERLGVVVGEGVEAMTQYAAPVPVERGVLFFIVAGAGLVAIFVEIAVFGLRRVPLAGLPLGVMYAIAASTAREGWNWVWFVLPAIGFLSLLVSEGRNRVALWGRSASPSARHQGLPQTDSLARSGRRAGAVALAAAVAVPAWLPALTDGFIGSGGSGGTGGGRTIRTDNPIVDLQRDLVQRENVEILRYRTNAERPEYIRTATLDLFTGEEWKLSQRDVPESQRVSEGLPWPPGLSPSDTEVRDVTYEFEITENFESRWLPLAYPVQAVEIDGDWRFDIATLDVVTAGNDDVHGKSYRATSLAVTYDAATLRDAPQAVDELQDMLELPDDVQEALAPYLDEAIGDLTNPHDRAAAMQSWFRSTGGFSYSLEREPGTSSSLLLDFLTNRIGYCEQYAATMAIMARASGIPARVAVGFTPGELQDDGSRIIRGHDSHAWPELYFTGVGWVQFEPTPATRTNAAPAWTLPVRSTDGNADTPRNDGADADSASDPLGPERVGDLPVDDLSALGGTSDGGSRWLTVLIAVVVLAVLLSVPQGVAHIIRAARWRRAEGNAVAEAEAAWGDFRDAVRDAGLRWDAAATPRGTRRQLDRQIDLGEDSDNLVWHLVRTIERARYAATSYEVPELRAEAHALRRQLLDARPRRQRVKAWLWPAAVRDVLSASMAAAAEALTWFDTAGERLRTRLIPVSRR
ncbi:MAG TPA: DUF3488 and transglutaminase-like domain-containing protein [Jiangellaceae bacterium]